MGYKANEEYWVVFRISDVLVKYTTVKQCILISPVFKVRKENLHFSNIRQLIVKFKK